MTESSERITCQEVTELVNGSIDRGVHGVRLAGRAARVVTPRRLGRLHCVEDLSCQELVELVTDYLEDALSPAERARFDAHVADCPGCEIYLRQVRTTISLAGASADVEGRPEVSGLLEAFRNWKRTGG